jgi:hypothetical protein
MWNNKFDQTYYLIKVQQNPRPLDPMHTLQTPKSKVPNYSNLQKENLGNTTTNWDLGIEITSL